MPVQGSSCGKGQRSCACASARAEPSSNLMCSRERGTEKEQRGTPGEKASLMRKPQESFPSFFSPPHPREELNSVILGGEATPALSAGSWNKWFVSDLQILKKKPTPL